MDREIITNSSIATQKAGIRLVKEVDTLRFNGRAAVIALEGHLGSGKTTFIQGLAEGMGVKENVLSPTFLILKQFPIALRNYKNLYHIDAYRLNNPGEIVELGFEDLLNDPNNIIVIEWADKIRKILPKNAIWIRFENMGGDKRQISINQVKNQKSKVKITS